MVAAGGTLAWRATRPTSVTRTPTIAMLSDDVKIDKITRIEVQVPNEPIVLTPATTTDGWSLPGNWPIRVAEVKELVHLLTHLKSRFEPIAITESTELKSYGLDPSQNPLIVKVTFDEKEHTFAFGEPAQKSGENPFARPNYLRVDENADIIRLGPDVLPVLSKPLDAYRRRQLFVDTDRVRVGSTNVQLPNNKVTQIDVKGETDTFSLRRVGQLEIPKVDPEKPDVKPSITPAQLAFNWELIAPIQDRPDPTVLEQFLVSLPELWAERFFTAEEQKSPQFRLRTGLDKPSRSITVQLAYTQARVLHIGNPSRVETRTVMRQMPNIPGQPPQPPREIDVQEKYYFAKLENNEQIFEVKEDKFSNLFASVSSLRDPSLARFEIDNVSSVGIEIPNKPAIILKQTKAEKNSKKPDRWDIAQPFQKLAESSAVTDLLRQLSQMSASGKDVFDPKSDVETIGASFLIGTGGPELTKYLRGLDGANAVRVRIAYEPMPGVKKEVTLLVGKEIELTGAPPPPMDPFNPMPPMPMGPQKKAFVQVEGYERVNLVKVEKLGELVHRDALAYRSRRLFDLGDAVVDAVTVQNSAEPYELVRQSFPESGWKLTKPVTVEADIAKAGNLAAELGRVEAKTYIDENATPETLAKFGLDKPELAVNLKFSDSRIPATTIQIGKSLEGTGDFYAKLADASSVFTINKMLVDQLKESSLTFRPLNVWSGLEPSIMEINIVRQGSDSYTILREMGAWKITTPFTANVGTDLFGSMSADLANVRAQGWISHESKDLMPFGLDPASKPIRVTVKMFTQQPAGAGNPPKDPTKTHVLIIGKPSTGKAPGRFAMVEGTPGVFTIDDPIAVAVDRDPLSLIDRKLLAFDPRSASKIVLTEGKESFTLVSDNGKWKAEATAFAIDQRTIDEVITRFANLRATGFAVYGANIDWTKYNLGARSLTITLNGAKPITHTITLGDAIAPGQGIAARIDTVPGIATIQLPPNTKFNAIAFAERSIWTLDPLDIIGISRKMGGQELSLEQVGTAWDIVKPKKENADLTTLEELVDSIARLRAERVEAIAPKDLKPFGLDTPTAEVTIEAKKSRVLKIGGPVPMSETGERFAMADGSDLVVVLPGGLAKRLIADPAAFRDRTLANFVNADRIELIRGGRELTFVKGNGGWKLTTPVPGDSEDVGLREMHDMLARLRAEEIVTDKPTPEQLKKFGLDSPSMRIRLLDGEKVVLSMAIGNRDGFRVYAQREKSDMVVLLDPAVTARLTQEYRKRSLFTNLDVSQAMVLTYSAQDTNFTLRKSPIGWINQAMPAERIDNDKVSDTLDAIASVRVERFVEDNASDAKMKEYGLNPPREVIVLTLQGSNQVLHIGRFEGDTKKVYARLPNQSAVFVLSEADANRILRRPEGFRKEPERELIPVPPKMLK